LPPAAPTLGPARRLPFWLPLVVGALLLLCYWPALRGGRLWDDQAHITTPALQSWAGLGQIWFKLGATQQYYPLLHSVFWVEHRLWGDATLGYHLANLIWHGTSACLFALALIRLGFGRATAACATLLFTLHPVMVESVAWMSEQKNTLSLVFYLAAALSYLKFDASVGGARPPRQSKNLLVPDGVGGARPPGALAPTALGPRPRRQLTAYLLATLLFLCALATKSVTATLPAALGVIIWWKRGKLELKRDILPLSVWLIIGLCAGLFTAHVEKTMIGADGSEFSLSAIQRGLLAGRVVWFYLGKLLWPAPLIWVYPHWDIAQSAAAGVAAVAAAIALTAVLLWLARRKSKPDRGPLAAWLFFAGSLFPVLGFVNVYPFRFSYVADHFQYLAALGVFALLGAAARFVPYAVAGLVLLVLGILTRVQSTHFADQITLYRDTLAKNPAAWMPEYNLGILLHDRGEDAEAVQHYQRAVELWPDYPEVYANWGMLLYVTGHPAEAADKELAALRLRPGYPEALNALGLALNRLGRRPEAQAQFLAAIQSSPTLAEAHFNLGNSYREAGKTDAALAEYETTIRLNPRYAEAQMNLGNLELQAGKLSSATAHFQAAIAAKADYAEAHNSLGYAWFRAGKADAAIAEYQEAVRLRPDYRPAWTNLAYAYHATGREADAQAILQALGGLGGK